MEKEQKMESVQKEMYNRFIYHGNAITSAVNLSLNLVDKNGIKNIRFNIIFTWIMCKMVLQL